MEQAAPLIVQPVGPPAELNLVDVRPITKERKIETEDPQDFFEPLVFKEPNVCEYIYDIYEGLQGHSQLRDRITCTPLYPDCLFICGTDKILEFNREQKKIRVLCDVSNTVNYNPLTAIKAHKNYVFFGDMEGTISRLTLGSLQVSQISKSEAYEMVNGFSFYEYDGKDYVVVALNSWNLAIKTFEVESLQLVHAIPVPLVAYKTCAGGVGVSPSNRFMVAIGDKQQIYVYEIVPDNGRCVYKIRKTFGVLGNCHTAHWAPDESCFAVSCEHGEVYLFSFKVESNNDLDIQLVATYGVPQVLKEDEEEYWRIHAIENVKFHPNSNQKLLAYAAANVGHVYIVDYTTFQIVQKFTLPRENVKAPFRNTGLDFSPDGNNLYVTFSTTESWEEDEKKPLGQLLSLKLKGVGTLTELCLKHIRKNKDNWHPIELQDILPESLFEKLSINTKY